MNYREWMEKGIQAKNYERYEEALEAFTQAIALDGAQAEPYFYRANIYNYSLENYMLAEEDYNRAIALRGDQESYYYNRALLYLNMGDPEAAMEDYMQALEINPNYALALWDVALLHKEAGEYETALAELDRVLELSPYSEAILCKDKGYIYMEMQQSEQAKQMFDKALALDAYLIAAYKGRAKLYLRLGDGDAAKRDCETALQYAPDDGELQRLLQQV